MGSAKNECGSPALVQRPNKKTRKETEIYINTAINKLIQIVLKKKKKNSQKNFH